MRSPVRKPLLYVLLVLNFAVWGITSQKILEVSYDVDTQVYSAPPLTFSVESAPQLPSHLSGKGIGKTVLLYRDYADVYGYGYTPREQGASSSCVGQSTACAVDMLGAVETKAGLRSLPPPPRSSASWIYGSSREVGEIEHRGRGSYCRLSVRSLEEVGFVYEENFFMLGYDLTGDSPLRDKEFQSGVPDELKPLAVNRIAGYYQLNSYEDVRDAIYSGLPVVFGSSVGFGRTGEVLVRDSDGFLDQPRFRFRGRYWLHAMCFIGVSDTERQGCLVQNSWGDDWVIGEQRFGDEPEGSFWVDNEVVDKITSQGDCFAIYGLVHGSNNLGK